MIFHWGNDLGRDLSDEEEESELENDGKGSIDAQDITSYHTIPGSEHRIDGKAFPAEIQLYGFNAHLFKNLSEAVHHPHGVVGIAIFVQEAIGERGATRGLRPITSQLDDVTYKGQSIPVTNLNLGEIMPDTEHYMTYEGSTTYPGCWETVSWILMNKPIYVTRPEMVGLRQLMRGDRISPKAPLGKNIRILQGLNSRSVRTNINFDASKKKLFPKGGGSSRIFKNKKKEKQFRDGKHEMSDLCPDVLNGIGFTTNSWIQSKDP